MAIRAFVVASLLLARLPAAHAGFMLPGGGGTHASPTDHPLASWLFYDPTHWTSDQGHAPLSFTNLGFSYLGNGSSLVVDNTNSAWLQYNVVETNGATNFSPSGGSLSFWFAARWNSTNAGGTGPGEWSRLFEVGSYTPDSSYGWWSLYVDPDGNNLYFSAQTNDLSSHVTTYVAAPIIWTTNYFHNVVVTYSATNTALYLDGALASNGPPLTVYPGPDVLANGLFIGSASDGVNQAHGLFNNVITYGVPLDAATIQRTFTLEFGYYLMNPWNLAMANLHSANASPATNATPNVITGAGNLVSLGATTGCVSTTNANQIWLTNITATTVSDGTMTVTFAIAGGQDYNYYDVFAGNFLTAPLGNGNWKWQGQGSHCQRYSLTGLPQGTVFLVLGTPLDTDGDGLTDAYENLVSKTNPNLADTDGDGLPDGWSVLLGLDGLTGMGTSAVTRAAYDYTLADWLNQVSGSVKSGSVTNDAEGNVMQVSQ